MRELAAFLSPAFSEPARVVARTAGQAVTAEQFLRRVAAQAAALAAHPGQRFGLFHEDAFKAAVQLFAAWFAGKTVVLPADRLPATDARLADRVDAWLAPMDARGDDAALAALRGSARATTDARLEVFTSGSTGEPVAIPKTLAQLDAELTRIEACWGAQVRGRLILATVPHQHVYGLLFRILWPLSAGHVFESQRTAFPETLAAQLEASAAVLVSSPAFLKRWPESLGLHPLAAPPHAVFSSGGPLPREVSCDLQARLGCPVTEIYGSSETGGIAYRVQGEEETPWRLHQGLEIRIDADQTLHLRSPFLPDAAQWYETGDRALSEEGGFRLLGRADRIVKIEEKRVSLDAIESVLQAQPEVSLARAVVLDDGRIGVVLVLSEAGHAEVATRGARALHQSLRQCLADSIEAVALPRRWRHVAALPVDGLGKSPLALLRALFEQVRTMPEARLIEREGDVCLLGLEVDEGLAAFEGHFADTPILPGVAQLDWACALAERHFGTLGAFSAVEALKFNKPVRPGMHLQLRIERQSAKSAIGFRYTCGEEAVSSGRLVFAGAPA
ncbi:AMP-binding protein [Niveibacterium sp. SC-1]|uniref:AMP-binding protein n=1 Tax=Niveibacterium sp. SC-1 TaxID=3135646 RepID=UPI00311FF1FE